jgi:dTDP-4-dehydrorhamnose reductase
MRWFHQVWNACSRLRNEGIPVEAVTAWSLLGTYNWNNLCTRDENFYEPGVFDLRNPECKPQPTALARLIQSLANKEDVHPVTQSQGSWETGRRILYQAEIGQMSTLSHPSSSRPILILGSTGTLGQAFARICGERNIHYVLLGREDFNITRRESLEALIHRHFPWAIINATGYVRIDDAEEDQTTCMEINVKGPEYLAQVAREMNLPLVTFSSDQVFDGTSSAPYTEYDFPCPINTYGRSKEQSEELLQDLHPNSLIIRTSAFFGPWDRHNFITKMLLDLRAGHEVLVPSDILISPTYVPHLVHETLTLLIDQEHGIFHLTNSGEMTWEEFARLAIQLSGDEKIRRDLLIPKPFHTFNLRAQRPRRSSLRSLRQNRMSNVETALKNYFSDLKEINP